MPDEHPEDPEDMEKPPSFFPIGDSDEPPTDIDLGEPVEVVVEGVFFTESPGNVQRFVLLSDGSRKLPILIGGFEAMAINLPLDGMQPDRPMTHDLIRSLIERLGATVERVLIDDIWSKTYYAKLYISQGKNEMEVDCRPSDAIALALRAEAPIFVRDGILNQTAEEE